MYQLSRLEDTIAAISTPSGNGGIGIIRISGKETLSICDKIFRPKNKKLPSGFRNFSVHYGWIVEKEVQIDEVLLTVMRSPKSYTKEDVAEISCHGGTVSLKTILNLVLESGARLAEPGEFTKRAFLNGRIDLTQAEAVLDVIQAKTDAFLRLSQNQLKGELSVELEGIREQLLKIYTGIEAIVNFPEDDLDAAGRSDLSAAIHSVQSRVERLIATSDQGKILKEGIKIVLCGRPNVGKSSLLNALLRQPRAIVTDIAGTTRDTIEETAQIQGIPLQLVDTAGILEPRDLVEEEAVKRSRHSVHTADLILFIADGSEEFSREDETLAAQIKDKNILVVLNKSDLGEKIADNRVETLFGRKKIIRVSALKRTAIDRLETEIAEHILNGKPVENYGLIVSNLRHVRSLKEGRESLDKAQTILKDGLSLEFVSEEIKSAVNCLDAITGRNIDEDLLDKIFAEFCIGK